MDRELISIAHKVARHYARACFWAEREDLEQEAVVAALRAERTFDPSVGIKLVHYAERACWLHLKRYLWKQSAPVNEAERKVHLLKGVHRAPLDHAMHVANSDAPDVDSAYAQWRAAVRAQVRYVLQHTPHAVAAQSVLLADVEPARAAELLDVPLADVHRAARLARRAIGNNYLMYQLWKEGP